MTLICHLCRRVLPLARLMTPPTNISLTTRKESLRFDVIRHCFQTAQITPQQQARQGIKKNDQQILDTSPAMLNDDPDVFGTISPNGSGPAAAVLPAFDIDEGDEDEHDRHERIVSNIYRPGKQHYLRKLNELAYEKKDLRAALEVLDVEMRENCVKPEQPHYRVLINACAQAGYTKKAFALFKEFQDRGLPRHVGILADLFHSCSNCHDKAYGLSQATRLLNKIREDHIRPNRILFHTMIQAFGRCGDLRTAFSLMDEFKSTRMPLTSDTFNLLLQGCVTDKKNGFRHALLVFRNMRRKKIPPSLFTYNLMIRCANECSLGEERHRNDLLMACLPRKEMERRLALEQAELNKAGGLSPGKVSWLDIALPQDLSSAKESAANNIKRHTDEDATASKNVTLVDASEVEGKELVKSRSPPNLLEPKPDLMNVLALNNEDTPNSRLVMMGGRAGLLNVMRQDKVTPDIKTLSMILKIENCLEAEEAVLASMKEWNILPDTGFFNQIIKQRGLRGEKTEGMACLELMSKLNVTPDIITFGCLAICCANLSQGMRLIRDLKSFGSQLNVEIMTSLMRGAAHNHSPKEMSVYLKVAKAEKITPNNHMLATVEQFYQQYRNHIRVKDEGGYVPYPVVLEMRRGFPNWSKFSKIYRDWLESTDAELTEDVWEQFKTSRDVMLEQKKRQKNQKKLTSK